MNENTWLYLQYILKRAIDFVIALLALFFLSPLLLAIAILIKLDSEGPVIYCHPRIGKNGRTFDLYKFRTMVCGGDDTTYMNYLRDLIESTQEDPSGGKPYAKMKDDSRVTRVGRYLRTYYLDELPQMLNILKGDLSLVGPRPHVQFEVDHYNPEQRRRLTVKPGATGMWQVSAKADSTFTELIEYDLEYIDNWNLLLDVKIILKTVFIMFSGGEGFWTRTAKRIPRRLLFGNNHRRAEPVMGNFESTSTENIKPRQSKLARFVSRFTDSFEEDRSINQAASSKE